jgi:hypothetical protein
LQFYVVWTDLRLSVFCQLFIKRKSQRNEHKDYIFTKLFVNHVFSYPSRLLLVQSQCLRSAGFWLAWVNRCSDERGQVGKKQQAITPSLLPLLTSLMMARSYLWLQLLGHSPAMFPASFGSPTPGCQLYCFFFVPPALR